MCEKKLFLRQYVIVKLSNFNKYLASLVLSSAALLLFHIMSIKIKEIRRDMYTNKKIKLLSYLWSKFSLNTFSFRQGVGGGIQHLKSPLQDPISKSEHPYFIHIQL